MHICLHPTLRACVPACLPARLHACMPACPPACPPLPACIKWFVVEAVLLLLLLLFCLTGGPSLSYTLLDLQNHPNRDTLLKNCGDLLAAAATSLRPLAKEKVEDEVLDAVAEKFPEWCAELHELVTQVECDPAAFNTEVFTNQEAQEAAKSKMKAELVEQQTVSVSDEEKATLELQNSILAAQNQQMEALMQQQEIAMQSFIDSFPIAADAAEQALMVRKYGLIECELPCKPVEAFVDEMMEWPEIQG